MSELLKPWDQRQDEPPEAYDAFVVRLKGGKVNLEGDARIWRVKYGWDDRIAAYQNQQAKAEVETSENQHKAQLIEAKARRLEDFRQLRSHGKTLMDMAMSQLEMSQEAVTDPETGEVFGATAVDQKGAIMMFNAGMGALDTAMKAENELLAINRLLKAQLKRSRGM